MRQMEEQCVFLKFFSLPDSNYGMFHGSHCRFTTYDFKKMQRRSYYPSNPQLVSTMTAATSSSGADPSRPVTPMTIPNDVPAHDSLNGNGYNQKLPPSPDGIDYDSNHQAIRMHDITNEKAY